MTGFDIRRFYDQYNIQYIERGVNVIRGEINVSCPFCNDSSNPDPSYHLGVDPETGFFSCWRNASHRGRRLHRLLMKISGASYAEVKSLLGEELIWLKQDEWANFVEHGFNNESNDEEKIKTLRMPSEFKPIKTGLRSTSPFVNYLVYNRKFKPYVVEDVIDEYALRYCLRGRYRDRVIVPIYFNNKLMTWTARAITKSHFRYDSLSLDQGAMQSIKKLVFHFDRLIETGGNLLFICEGPFDAIKLDFYAKQYQARATCLFNAAAAEEQVYLLYELAEEFDYVVILLDNDEFIASQKICNALSILGDRVLLGELPKDIKDPGDLSLLGVKKLVKKYQKDAAKREDSFSLLPSRFHRKTALA